MVRTEQLLKRNKNLDSSVFLYYLDKIIETYNPRRVFVVGSVATGTAGELSDIDFVVEADGFIDTEAVVGAIDIVVYDQMSEALREDLLKHGVLIYEKK